MEGTCAVDASRFVYPREYKPQVLERHRKRMTEEPITYFDLEWGIQYLNVMTKKKTE
jgi:hypothetical protein